MNACVSSEWNPFINGKAFIYPCMRWFFIMEFDKIEDRDLILNYEP